MASADFSVNSRLAEISPGKALILKVYAGCIYTTVVIGYELCKDVVTHPHCPASYAVPVRPYTRLRRAASFGKGHHFCGRLPVTQNALAAY